MGIFAAIYTASLLSFPSIAVYTKGYKLLFNPDSPLSIYAYPFSVPDTRTDQDIKIRLSFDISPKILTVFLFPPKKQENYDETSECRCKLSIYSSFCEARRLPGRANIGLLGRLDVTALASKGSTAPRCFEGPKRGVPIGVRRLSIAGFSNVATRMAGGRTREGLSSVILYMYVASSTSIVPRRNCSIH